MFKDNKNRKKQPICDPFLTDAISIMEEKGELSSDDMVIVIGESFGPRDGASFMEISQVKNIVKSGKRCFDRFNIQR